MIFRLFELMEKTKTTQTQLAQAIGASQGNISDWKKGRSFPKSDVLAKIADYFDVSTDYLLGRTDDPSPGTAPAAPDSDPLRSTLLENYDQLNQEGKEKLVDLSDDMVSSGKYIKSHPTELGGE